MKSLYSEITSGHGATPAFRHKDRDGKKCSRHWKPTRFLCGQKGHI